MEETPPEDFHDVHFQSLPSQGNIYTLSKLIVKESERRALLLAGTLNRRSFVLEYDEKDSKISSKELNFTYIPAGAEIISIDAICREEFGDFVVGITIIIKSSVEGNGGGQFFNIYNDDVPLEDSLAQNCQSLELDFIPYQLTHAPLKEPKGPSVWLLSGSDFVIHPYAYDLQDRAYREIPLLESFPELIDENDDQASPSIVQWLEIIYCQISGTEKRLTACGREDGRLRITRTDALKGVIEAVWTKDSLNGPITHLKFFRFDPPREKVPEVFRHSVRSGNVDPEDWSLVVVYALAEARVYCDIARNGLEVYHTLEDSDQFDVATCVLVADIDFNSRPEILIGTYAQTILFYAYNGMKWERRRSNLSARTFPAPILKLDHEDLTSDGIKDLIIMTTKGLHILQHDRDVVLEMITERLNKILPY